MKKKTFTGAEVRKMSAKAYHEIATLRARVAVLERALEEIKEKQGRVCIGFAVCTHPACASSHASWAIADIALATAEQEAKRGTD